MARPSRYEVQRQLQMEEALAKERTKRAADARNKAEAQKRRAEAAQREAERRARLTPEARRKEDRRKLLQGAIVMCVLGGVVALFAALGSHGKSSTGSGTDTTASAASSSFSASVDDVSVVDPADVSINYTVINTGGTPATPTCFIDATSQSGYYHGTVNYSEAPAAINPGGSETVSAIMRVTNQGAAFITPASVTRVDCHA